MQMTLSFENKNKKYVSKPFDFETMCIINDAHNDRDKKGPLNMCRGAVDYMFEGTDATEDVLKGLDVKTRTALCLKAWEFYVDSLPVKKA